MVDLTEASAGRAVSVSAGEKVRVTLAEAGGSGYHWRVGDACAELLHLDGEEEGAIETRLGAPRERVWGFSARGEGACELRFELARSWEKTVTGRVVVFPVAVRKKVEPHP